MTGPRKIAYSLCMHARRAPRGFSVLRSLMATAVLSGIVALFAAPQLQPAEARRLTRAEAEKLAVAFADARLRAVREQVCTQVDVVPIEGRVSILSGTIACEGPLSEQRPTALDERALSARGTLDDEVELVQTTQLVRFSPSGRAASLRPATTVWDRQDPDGEASVHIGPGGVMCIESGDDPTCPEAWR